ncbi:MAG TPA: tRNA dihydrouridine synthase DusB [Gammaproteobacteria bacterium]|nr:tRNA dihydrouridine synthase DusB [Gammaproteobacteria bacterium]
MRPLKIGSHIIEHPFILAPMAGVTDRPFRQMCKKLGAGLAVTEMVGAGSFLHGSDKTHRRANHEGETRPCSVQIVGADPKMMAEVAKRNAELGADIIDINMGCPAKKVCNTLAGSALLKDELLVGDILESVVNAVNIPVTLKIRTGWDVAHRNGVKIAQIAQNAGIQALAIHGRTRACMFKGEAEYETIRAIKAAVNIPIIANGDIDSPQKALLVLENTQADGIMIGRAAQGMPWIFREIIHFFKNGILAKAPTLGEIRQTLTEHIENLYAFYGEHRGMLVARKHVSWYTKGQRQGASFRQHFNQLTCAKEQRIAIDRFFDERMEHE